MTRGGATLAPSGPWPRWPALGGNARLPPRVDLELGGSRSVYGSEAGHGQLRILGLALRIWRSRGAGIELLTHVAQRSHYADANLFWDATPAVRFAGSFQYTTVEYIDHQKPRNLRGMGQAVYVFQSHDLADWPNSTKRLH